MKHRFFIFSLFIIYMLVTTLLLVGEGVAISPSRYFFVILFGGLLVKKTRNFFLDWSPFLFIVISYDFLRWFVPNLVSGVSYSQIYVDQMLFGTLPNIFLQRHLYQPGVLSWYDFLFTFIYLLHFILFLAFGFLLWTTNRRFFREFVTAISLLSYAAWITYLLFPAAPPWIAVRDGFLTGVVKIMDYTLPVLFGSSKILTAYHNLNPNPIAAIPSLHAAYPFLIFLFALRTFKRKAWFFLPYVLTTWFSIVYLGEHYVIDVATGILYATFFYLFSKELLHHFRFKKIFRQIALPKWLNT